MKVVLQRAGWARVRVDGSVVGEIARGLLVLVGVVREDDEDDVAWMAGKIATLRLFSDAAGKMNRSVIDEGGAILSVSQFTLCADVRNGQRPSFGAAAPPERARGLWDDLNRRLSERGLTVASGIFGADMRVELLNDGPVTICLDSQDRGVSARA